MDRGEVILPSKQATEKVLVTPAQAGVQYLISVV
jgi:hypothetical protein